MLKVLFCSVKWEYGKESNGTSFVYQNFFDSLHSMQGVEAKFFGVDEVMQELGRDKMNEELIAQVQEWKPDILFCMLFTEELKKETIAFVTQKTKTKTVNWFADDHWRFSIFSKYWAPLFTVVATTDSQAPQKYKALGIQNVLKTQWAANPRLYHPTTEPGQNESAAIFVGEKYGNRGKYVQLLRDFGINVVARGSGWEEGRINFPEMVKLFGSRGVILNFTDSPYEGIYQLRLWPKFFVRKELGKYKLNIFRPLDTWDAIRSRVRRQIKARVFEVPACGGFLLTAPADNLEEYFIPGKEIEVFRSKAELKEKTKFYLANPKAREEIAQAGRSRVLKEHTYESRFREIFAFLNTI